MRMVATPNRPTPNRSTPEIENALALVVTFVIKFLSQHCVAMVFFVRGFLIPLNVQTFNTLPGKLGVG
jgi:hypothetical protein